MNESVDISPDALKGDLLSIVAVVDLDPLIALQKPEYQNMISVINRSALEIHKVTQIFNKSQSQFMDNLLTVSHMTPFRNLRQVLAEMNRTQAALNETYFNLELKKNKVEKLKAKLDKLKNDTYGEVTSDDIQYGFRDFDIKKLEIKIQQAEYQVASSMEYVNSAIRKMANYTAQYNAIKKQLPDLSEKTFEEEEERYHIMKAFEQGLCAARAHGGWIDEGNQIYFHQIGVNGSQAQNEMSKYLQEEFAILDKGGEVTHEDQLKWLESMADKFKGSAVKFAKYKGMTVMSEFACTGWENYVEEDKE
jgi:hypothetical protein